MPDHLSANPSVIILGGANGAGKTTVARTILAYTLRLTTFVNADAIGNDHVFGSLDDAIAGFHAA